MGYLGGVTAYCQDYGPCKPSQDVKSMPCRALWTTFAHDPNPEGRRSKHIDSRRLEFGTQRHRLQSLYPQSLDPRAPIHLGDAAFNSCPESIRLPKRLAVLKAPSVRQTDRLVIIVQVVAPLAPLYWTLCPLGAYPTDFRGKHSAVSGAPLLGLSSNLPLRTVDDLPQCH